MYVRTSFRTKYLVVLALVFVFSCVLLNSNWLSENSSFSVKFEKEQEYTLPNLQDKENSLVDLDIQRILPSLKALSESNHGLGKSKKLNIIITSTWRSGSTLLGEIISSYPNAFYHYEPLLSMGLRQIGTGDREQINVQRLLHDLLNCNYGGKEDYLAYAYGNQDMFTRNTRLWSICSLLPRYKCYKPENIGMICSVFPLQVMKVVRTRLSLLTQLLAMENTKIIWLVRDPRAIMNSRLTSVKWCDSVWCKNPKYLCDDLLKDFNTFLSLKKQHPNELTLLRYEDLANNPKNVVGELFNFLDLPMSNETIKYLDAHMYDDIEAPWSTVHNPKVQSKKWLKTIPWNLIVSTQFHCRTVMEKLGYRAFENENEKKLFDFVNSLHISL